MPYHLWGDGALYYMHSQEIVWTTGDLFSLDLDLRSKVRLKVNIGNIGLE